MRFRESSIVMPSRLVLAFVLASTASAPVFAQAPDSTTAAADDSEEIVVTARKRNERLRDVPESVSALTAEDLETKGIATVNDLGRQVPGLQLNRRQDNAPNVTLRGVGSFGNVQGVGFFIDDVQTYTDQTMVLEDLDRIEILKGPQGTLYGGSAIGGAIKYVLKKPHFETDASAKVEVGGNGYQNIFAALNTPIVAQKAAFRVSGYYVHDDGFLRDINLGFDAQAMEEYGILGQLLIEPSDRFRILASVRYRNLDGSSNAYAPQDDLNTPEYFTALSFRPYQKRESLSAILNLDYDLDSVSISSISSYSRQEYDWRFDLDYTPANRTAPFTSNPFPAEVYTQELRLTSNADSNIDWIVGLYAQRLDNVNSIPTPLGLTINGAVTINPYARRTVRQDDLAAFGTVNVQLGNFTLGGGVRFLKTIYKANIQILAGAPVNTFYENSDTAILPKISLSYKTDGGTLFYVNAAQGYESGKMNLSVNPSIPFDAESAWNFEAGAKGQALNGALDFEVAVFRISYTNKQVEDRYQDQASGLVIEAIRNIGDSYTNGAEFSLAYRPVDGLSLNAAVGFLDSKWEDGAVFHRGEPDQQDLSGKDVPISPDWTINLGADYSTSVAAGLVASLHVDAAYTGQFRWKIQDIANSYNPAFWIVNARVAIGDEDGRWELAGRVENLFDKDHYNEWNPGYFLSGAALANYNATGSCPVATPRCSIASVASPQRLVVSISLKF